MTTDSFESVPPDLPYEPPTPDAYRPGIGLIGCGDITTQHLTAYRKAGFDVVALCDIVPDRAEQRREEFYPEADVYTDHEALLARDDVAVVDIALHPDVRVPVMEDAIEAGKHVLSQKPFVEDLATGRRLVERAEDRGVRLAVNQNARWAPHFSYFRHAVRAGVVGDLSAIHCDVAWNHNTIVGTKFDEMDHVILYDFAIHWFDACVSLRDAQAHRVYATTTRTPTQEATPPLVAGVSIEYPDYQATLAFVGDAQYGTSDRTRIWGDRGAITATAPTLATRTEALEITVETEHGRGSFAPTGQWFPDGFTGTMGELLCAIEEDRPPANDARSNLRSLALCFAAVESADRGEPVDPRTVRGR